MGIVTHDCDEKDEEGQNEKNGTLPVDSLSRSVTPIIASVLQKKLLNICFFVRKQLFHLFCEVDNHDGVAGDGSARVGRSLLDPLPVVHPVDLQRLIFFTFFWL